MQTFHQHNILIAEQQVYDLNPLYELAHIPITFCSVHDTHTKQG